MRILCNANFLEATIIDGKILPFQVARNGLVKRTRLVICNDEHELQGFYMMNSTVAGAKRPNTFCELKAIASCFYERFNRRDITKTFDDFVATDLINHTMQGKLGRKGWLEFDEALIDACPDVSVQVNQQYVDGNTVITHWTCSGTHTAAFYDQLPTGNVMCLSGISIDRIEAGKIKEHLTMADFTGFLQSFSCCGR